MRHIKRFVLHCTDTPTDTELGNILKYWQEVKKWDMPGYHFIVDGKGVVTQLADVDYITNGVKGFNANSLHFAYIGRYPNELQLKSLREEIDYWQQIYKVPVIGHNDLNPLKSCPNFNAGEWYYHGRMYGKNTDDFK